MELDNTQIVIRERGYLDLLDLAVRVVRAHAGRLGLALAVGIAPCFALNHWLLAESVQADIEGDAFPAFWFLLATLMVWEIPLATTPATVYLGGALFNERPSARQIAARMLRSTPQLIWYQVILRGLLALFFPAWLLLFTQWNFLNEVILLERNPLVRRAKDGPSTGRRRRALHAGLGGDLFGQTMGTVLLGGFLLASIWLSLFVARGMLFDIWTPDTAWLTFHFELALWIVVGFFSVVRFLSYLDLRIRREGWEMELLMRAEAARLRQTVKPG